MTDIEQLIAQFPEQTTLQGLGENVGKHCLCWTVFYAQFIVLYTISDEKISDVYVSGAFAAGGTTVAFEENCTLVILIEYYIVVDRDTLCFHKVPCP